MRMRILGTSLPSCQLISNNLGNVNICCRNVMVHLAFEGKMQLRVVTDITRMGRDRILVRIHRRTSLYQRWRQPTEVTSANRDDISQQRYLPTEMISANRNDISQQRWLKEWLHREWLKILQLIFPRRHVNQTDSLPHVVRVRAYQFYLTTLAPYSIAVRCCYRENCCYNSSFVDIIYVTNLC